MLITRIRDSLTFISRARTLTLSIIILILPTLCWATPLVPGERHTFFCKGERFYENWVVDPSHDKTGEIKWNISGTKLKLEGGYYVLSSSAAKVHGLFNRFKGSSKATDNELLIDYESKIDDFLDKLTPKTTVQGDFTGQTAGAVFSGKIWMRVNSKKQQETIFGKDTVTEIILKVKPDDGEKSTQRTWFAETSNRIVAFSGNSPLKYSCELKKIEK